MIIWLASYPKSGNTWIRSIVSALVYSQKGNFDMKLLSQIPQFPRASHFKDFDGNFEDINEIKKYWIKAQEKINLDNKLYFYKTHNANIKIDNYLFTNRSNTIGTIYIVRDPRSIINSISNHFNLTQQEAKNFIISKRVLKEKSNKGIGVSTVIGNWEDHYISWTQKNSNLLIIKYEDLIKNIEKEIYRISNFILQFTKLNITDDKINKIRSSIEEKLNLEINSKPHITLAIVNNEKKANVIKGQINDTIISSNIKVNLNNVTFMKKMGDQYQVYDNIGIIYPIDPKQLILNITKNFDEIYQILFVSRAKVIGRILWKKGDGGIIDGSINGVYYPGIVLIFIILNSILFTYN